MKEANKNDMLQRLIHIKQLLQFSGLCGTPFLSYLPKLFTQLYRALYGDNNMAAGNQQKTSDLEFTFPMKALSFRL